jgi:AraC-like DNA-binding protein
MLASTHNLRDSTRVSSDPFSDILKFTQAESLVTGGFTAGGSWAIRFPAADKIKFFAVVKGTCWVRIDGENEPIHVGTGDVGLLSAHRSFVIASDLTLDPVDAMKLFRGSATNTAHLGNSEEFVYLGGHVLLDPASRQLLSDVLPPWIHIPASAPQAVTFHWLLEQLVQEGVSEQPGASLASAQLAQLLFIQILRAHLKSSNSLPAGWLRALGDPRIAPALRLMHIDPSHSWGLEELAKAAAMSRTTFATRFKEVAGVPPLTYLLNWRMLLAQRALRDGITSISVIAQSVGYTSESAFSNAFKRVKGLGPKRYRDTRGSSANSSNSVEFAPP